MSFASLAARSICVVVAALLASHAAGGAHAAHHVSRTAPAPHAAPALAASRSATLAVILDQAQATLEQPGSSPAALTSAGRAQQLAIGALATGTPALRRATLALLRDPAALAATRADLTAAADLAGLTTPRPVLPPWRIVQPPRPDLLRSYYLAAQARSRVPWRYLAAIEFVESRFGRIVGPSTAGAQGPMQFLPSTWAEYGHGSIYDQRAAVLGAARFLAANGAPGNMPRALYAYNNSSLYVGAISAYASELRQDPRQLYGYYHWQVIYRLRAGRVVLPIGYPHKRALPVSY